MSEKSQPKWYMKLKTFEGFKRFKRTLEQSLSSEDEMIELTQDDCASLILKYEAQIIPLIVDIEKNERELDNVDNKAEVEVSANA